MPTDTVHWTNNHWESGKLEIRKGNAPRPEDNPLHRAPTLPRGATHTEHSEGEDFWWRRTNPPGDGVFIHRPCYGNGATYDETF